MLMSDESAEDGVRLLWQLHLLLALNPSTCGFHKIKKRERERETPFWWKGRERVLMAQDTASKGWSISFLLQCETESRSKIANPRLIHLRKEYTGIWRVSLEDL